ncbi:MAG: TetR/AcrR family transcriptional regulator [Desulfuromonadaceae bacterium]|nr:TetR/AcrR family transcriptional regulator [Desulfuromonadaceae bacterium]
MRVNAHLRTSKGNKMAGRIRESTEVRQIQITEAALKVIGQKGINGATTAEIASAAGISEGNIYRHFKNKEEIFIAVVNKIGKDLESLLDAVSDIADPLQKLEEIFKNHLSYIEAHIGIPRVIFSEEVLVLNKNLREKVKHNITKYSSEICSIISQAQNAGIINQKLDPSVVTSMFIGTINFTAIRWVMNDFSNSLTAEVEKLWMTFTTAITTKG